MRLQCNGSWVAYQHLSDGLRPITVFRRRSMTRTWDTGVVPQGSLLGLTSVITGWSANQLIFSNL